ALKEVIVLIRQEGVWVILQKQVRQLGQNMRIFLVEFLFGKEGVALYGFGEKIVTQVMALLPLDDVLIPMLSHEHKNEKRVRQVFHTGFKYSFWFFSASAVALAILIPWIVRSLFPSYGASIPVLRAMVICLPVSGLATLLSVLFISHYKQKTLFYFVIIRWLWFFPVAYLFASLFGLKGIGLEYALALLAFTAMRYYALTKLHPWLKISWRELFRFTAADREFARGIVNSVVDKWKKKMPATSFDPSSK
nr:oligosaccharide flippase family protein [Patescibacteria group bacterium]